MVVLNVQIVESFPDRVKFGISAALRRPPKPGFWSASYSVFRSTACASESKSARRQPSGSIVWAKRPVRTPRICGSCRSVTWSSTRRPSADIAQEFGAGAQLERSLFSVFSNGTASSASRLSAHVTIKKASRKSSRRRRRAVFITPTSGKPTRRCDWVEATSSSARKKAVPKDVSTSRASRVSGAMPSVGYILIAVF